MIRWIFHLIAIASVVTCWVFLSAGSEAFSGAGVLIALLCCQGVCFVLLNEFIYNRLCASWTVWLFQLIFILGYYCKGVWFGVYDIGQGDFGLRFIFAKPMSSPIAMQTAMYASLVGYAVFSLCVVLIGIRRMRFQLVDAKQLAFSCSNSKFGSGFWLLVAAVSFTGSIVVGLIRLRLGMGMMGEEMFRLPYKLGSMMFYSRTLLFPLLLNVAITYFLYQRKYMVSVVLVSLGLLLSLYWSFIMASRGAAILGAVPIAVVIIRSGLGKKYYLLIVLFAFSFFSLMHPLVTAYRAENNSNPGAGVINNMAGGLQRVELSPRLIYSGARAIVMRVQGFEGLLLGSYHSDGSDVGLRTFFDVVVLDQMSFGTYFTYYYMQHDDLGHQNSPGMLGAFYIFGKNWFMILGLVGWILLSSSSEAFLQRKSTYLAEGILGVFIVSFLKFSSEGRFDYLIEYSVCIFLFYYFMNRILFSVRTNPRAV